MRATPKWRTAFAALVTAAAIGAPAVPAHAVTGPAETDNARGFTARLDIGNGAKACSAALVAPEWLITAASCFADNPAESVRIPAGAPKLATKAVVGRTDLTTTDGAERTVVHLVPREDRDVVLARLSAPVANVRTARIADAPAQTGEKLTLTGYGRTKDEWAPVKAHNGTFTATALGSTDLDVTGDNAAICAGDAGAPLFRTSGDIAQIVSVASRSDQGGCFGIDTAQTSTKGVTARTDDLAAWADSTVKAAPVADFNGDGIEDIAISDPKATVGGNAEAGAVRVVYGGGKGNVQLDQSLSFVPGEAEAGDRFGQSLATVDYNQDGYTDLVVGVPFEDAGPVADAGMVSVVYGSAGGLGKGRVSEDFVQGQGNGALKASGNEKGDMLGWSVAAGKTRGGEPFIVIGDPGESIGAKEDAGNVFYVRGGTSVNLTQEAGLSGGLEAGDRVGWSVAADANNIAIGGPGEDIDGAGDAGCVWVLSHQLNADRKPTERANINQNSDKVSGGSETGDALGTSVALVENGPNGDSILAAGAPGESITNAAGTDVKNAGSVTTFKIPASGGWTQSQVIHQDQPDVIGGIETGDRFGETLQAINLSPKTAPTWQTLQLVVGVPGESQGPVTAAGAVQTMTLLGAPGPHNDVLYAGHNGLPGTPGANQRIGQAVAVSPTHIYVGMPTGPNAQGAAYAVPWQNVTSYAGPGPGPDQPVTVYQPGKDGIPAGGKAFGAVIR
ncbi:trypsin-like serine protease [Streptomyces hiroshimensis]|uniref:Esterase n=1 Tax=Streptomyces hiroshimensis TaxID=66424 RepID=A0ABQ2Z8A4_9ACTN|nr:trypsin-like serine protease [Streptomyces hiroshimensis]GGY06605.1 esterase [Streptomyces hiroshimensis]